MSSSHLHLYGLTAEFDSAEQLLNAARTVFDKGFRRIDAFTPYPIEELPEIIGHKHSAVPLIMLIGGIIGAVTAYGMEWYAMGYYYPLDVGGRPLNSWPLYIPITFELTVLFSALSGVAGFLILCRLPRVHHPLFSVPGFEGVSTDKFVLWIEAVDPHFDERSVRQLFYELEAKAVTEVHGK
ncbi:MAG TPA: DUF3341 domain-containing protein [Chthoniobacterales bacterium]